MALVSVLGRLPQPVGQAVAWVAAWAATGAAPAGTAATPTVAPTNARVAHAVLIRTITAPKAHMLLIWGETADGSERLHPTAPDRR
ncbi:osmotically inducible periplasmic protein [Streptomyces azureus]|uniref:Osmotically inducible periplasmic protein n=1 Tax=Streptomyces azureus TaxID=146537 RepID=A0A0K8PJ25_STRAJ|nr:osmotically inducible periplasmic protein [Streptomyces azureus]